MSKYHTASMTLLALAVSGLCLSSAALAERAQGQAAQAERFAPGRLLVKPRAGVSEADLDRVLKGAKGQRERRLRGSSVQVVRVPVASEQALARWLAAHPEVESAELDRLVAPQSVVPNDTYYPYAWHLPMVGAPAAWDHGFGMGVTVAVLDAGVDGAHSELAGQLVSGWNVISENTDTADLNGHGTEVAGIIAAAGNNAAGVTGLAWEADLMPVRVTNRSDGYAYFSDIAEGIYWAADHGARVINVSYEVVSSATVDAAAAYARTLGGVVFASAGNEGLSIGLESPNLMIISATGSDDVLMSWSSFGPGTDLAAPGNAILTTNRNNAYANVAGTSFAAPVAAGAAALMLAANPSLSAQQVEDLMKASAVDLGAPGWDATYAAGRLNVAAAVQAAVDAGAATPDTTPPSVSILSPAAAASVSGVVAVDLAASDDQEVAQVNLYVNGVLVASDTTAPYGIAWDSSLSPEGAATLVAEALDGAGNAASSAPVAVSIDNIPDDTTAPSVALTSPSAGATLAGTVSVTLAASDNVGVSAVSLYANGVLVGTDTTAPYSFSLDTTGYANGALVLSAQAQDAAGNLGTSPALNVSVNNHVDVDTTAPVPTITSPVNGRRYSSTISLKGSAVDTLGAGDTYASGIATLKFYVDGALVCTSTTASITCSKSVAKGNHTATLTATDQVGNARSASVSFSR